MEQILEPLALNLGMSGVEMMDFYIAQVQATALENKSDILWLNIGLGVLLVVFAYFDSGLDPAPDTPLMILPAAFLLPAMAILAIVFIISNKELENPSKYAYERALQDAQKLSNTQMVAMGFVGKMEGK